MYRVLKLFSKISKILPGKKKTKVSLNIFIKTLCGSVCITLEMDEIVS